MKLRTSFFNGTVLKKDLIRFAPLWAIYTAILLLVQTSWSDLELIQIARRTAEAMSVYSVVNFFYAGICALLLFGDLFKARLCNALHAMPLRREGWLITHSVAGSIFCLVPYGAVCVTELFVLGEYWYLALLQLAAALLSFLVFFGIGTLCVLCTGNALGAIAAYAGGIFLAPICLWLAGSLFNPALEGVTLPEELVLNLCPAIRFAGSFVLHDYDKILGWKYLGIRSSQWIYLAVACAIGIAAWVGSIFIYRRRKLESAGDFLAVKWLSPFFLAMYTLCVGTLVYALFSGGENYLFLLVGLVIGFFTGKMLLERTVKVFRIPAFLQLGALAAALALAMWLLWLDPLGTIHRVPELSQVKNVAVIGNYANRLLLDEPEDVEKILEIHETLTEKRRDDRTDIQAHWIQFRYTLKDGSTYERSYQIELHSPEWETLAQYLSSFEAIFRMEYEQVLEKLDYVVVYAYGEYKVPEEQLPRLMEAIRADCQAGAMGQLFTDGFYVAYNMQIGLGSSAQSLRVTNQCENTIKLLKELGVNPN